MSEKSTTLKQQTFSGFIWRLLIYNKSSPFYDRLLVSNKKPEGSQGDDFNVHIKKRWFE